jgi:hypothetical protein
MCCACFLPVVSLYVVYDAALFFILFVALSMINKNKTFWMGLVTLSVFSVSTLLSGPVSVYGQDAGEAAVEPTAEGTIVADPSPAEVTGPAGATANTLSSAQATDTNLRMEVKFCSDGDSKYFTTNPGAEFTLCADVTNPFPFPVTANFFFNNGVMSSGIHLCDAFGTSLPEKFDNYNEDITIPAQSTVRIQPKGRFLFEDLGEQYGCLSHEINQQGAVAEAWYAIRLRNSSTFTVFVAGDIEVGVVFDPSLWGAMIKKWEKIGIAKEWKGIVVWTKFTNNGWLIQDIQLSGSMTDLLGKRYEFVEISRAVAPGNTELLSFVVEELPWYQLWFTTDISISHAANYGRIDPSYLNDDITRTYSYQETVTFFIMPWWLMVGIIALLLLIIIIKKIRKQQRAKLLKLQQELEALKNAKAS